MAELYRTGSDPVTGEPVKRNPMQFPTLSDTQKIRLGEFAITTNGLIRTQRIVPVETDPVTGAENGVDAYDGFQYYSGSSQP